MKQYRLLRDNKESGPYTTEQLLQMGLKKYDLIWVEGKSAAWRYPCEIEEFKPYAPAVEEQPFDRFFKRPATITTQKKENALAEKETITRVIVRKEKPRIKIKADCKKIEPVIIEDLSYRENQIPTTAPSISDDPSWESAWLDWEQEKKAVAYSSQKSETIPAIETKFSQSLDDIKERYVKTVLKEKNVLFSFNRYKSYIAVAVIIITVLASGIWLGYKWSTNNNSLQASVKKQDQPLANANHNINQPENNDVTQAADDTKINETPANKAEINIVPVTEYHTPAKPFVNDQSNKPVYKNQNKELVKKRSEFKQVAATDIQPASLNVPDEKNISLNRQPDAVEDNNKRDIFNRNGSDEPQINDYISVDAYAPTANNAVGVEYTVQNISDIPIDLVMIDLQYFDAGGRFMKGQTVYVRNINAGESVNVKAPDDPKAAKINYKVSMVSSDKNNLYLIAD